MKILANSDELQKDLGNAESSKLIQDTITIWQRICYHEHTHNR